MLRERPGNVVVLSGRNRRKIDQILASVQAGLHVLGDKPWILVSADLPTLASALAEADRKGLVAYDIMTERFEIATILQRALVNDPATFGEMVRGTEADPGVYVESVHHLMKVVAGAPNIRPPWFFDIAEQGEGLNDIGTHLVDLVQWTLFPEQAVDYRSDVRVLAAQRWPTWIPESDFRRVTGGSAFDSRLAGSVKDGKLKYYANTLVSYTVRGVHTKLNVIWDWEAPAGAGRRAIESQDATASLSGDWRGRPRRRNPYHRPRGLARGSRSPLCSSGGQLFQIRARSAFAAGVGASKHAGEVLRHDERDRAQPPKAAQSRAAHCAEVSLEAPCELTSPERLPLPSRAGSREPSRGQSR
jgi:Putative oxidoreductase C terminal domain